MAWGGGCMPRVYLAGKISGEPNYQKIFANAADKLRSEGYEVYNPAAANQEGRDLSDIMATLLPQLCASDTVALLPNWRSSGGAIIEWKLAKYLGKTITYL